MWVLLTAQCEEKINPLCPIPAKWVRRGVRVARFMLQLARMSDSPRVRTAIVSDQAIYLFGVATLARAVPGVEIVGEAGSPGDALQLLEMTRPELTLLDLREPHGQETTAQMRTRWPGMKIVRFVRPADEVNGDELPPPGCYTFPRDISTDEFRAALAQVLQAPHDSAPRDFPHTPDEDPVEEVREPTPPPRSQQVIEHELMMAGKIQADILPVTEPVLPGWDLAARLLPARETSGDFYDFIPLTDRKLGLVVADVTDKGMGAALFMALSATLLRTYASRFPTLPALTLSAVSERILNDTRGGMFVTALFGILEPHTGRFIYASAGHPPGYLIHAQRGRESVEELRPTGMALGVSEKAQWRQKIARLAPGDFLILYTDGITEAENTAAEFFGSERIQELALNCIGCSAREILNALLDEVHRFTGSSARQDDIAIVVIRREP